MADDETVDPLPEAVREQQHRQAGHAKEHHEGLELETLRSAEAPDNLGQDADDEEICADDEHRQRRPQDGPRGVDVDLGESGARVGQRQQEHPIRSALDSTPASAMSCAEKRMAWLRT